VIPNDLALGAESVVPLILGNGPNDPYPIYDRLRATQPLYRWFRRMSLLSGSFKTPMKLLIRR
jgi:hypothetical protein